MKSFFNFFREARTSTVSDQAQKRGLTGDGHGNWYDKEGARVAVTSRGTLQMLTKKEPKQEKPSSETQLRPSFIVLELCFQGMIVSYRALEYFAGCSAMAR